MNLLHIKYGKLIKFLTPSFKCNANKNEQLYF